MKSNTLEFDKQKDRSLFISFNLQDGTGIAKKVNSEFKAMQKLLCGKLDFVTLREDGLYYNNDIIAKSKGRNYSFDKFGFLFDALSTIIEKNNYNIVYLRYVRYARPSFIKLLSVIRKKSHKLIVEIPTYPYDGEFLLVGSGFLNKIKQYAKYFVERIYRKKLYRYVDYFVTFSDDDYIFNVKTIKITNGIDLASLPLIIPFKHEGINLVAIAKITKWHGYDRLIKGLFNYYNNNPKQIVNLKIIGSSYDNTLNELKSLTQKLNLSKHIEFIDEVKYDLLTQFFETADIGIGSLGRHRCGIKTMATLKNREYAARGIPFIYSENDLTFDHKDFICKFSADETPINIEKIVDFYYKTKNINQEKIRKTVEKLDWYYQMNRVINEIIKE